VRLGTPFLAGLARTVERSPVSEPEAEGLSDMLVGMLWTLSGGSDRDASPGLRSTALLERMRLYALEHLHDPGLGPEQIARAHFVSTRYVHKLFAASGCGVAAWIRVDHEGTVHALVEVPLQGQRVAMVEMAAERLGIEFVDEFVAGVDQARPRHAVHPRRVDAVEMHGMRVRAVILEDDPQPVAIFPESTTGPGTHLLPFRSSLFAAVAPAAPKVAVRPVVTRAHSSVMVTGAPVTT